MKKRVGLLDEIRGFAILCMVVYHIMFDLKFIFGLDIPIFFDGWFNVIRDVFAGIFIFISGAVCRYSSNNLKRGVQCFFLGMVITFVTGFVTPDMPVYFGVLHCLGICMMCFGLVEKFSDRIPAVIGLIVSVVIFALTLSIPQGFIGIKGVFGMQLPTFLYSTDFLFPLGFPSFAFSSSDYFPIVPWLFLFFAGAFFGVFVKDGKMPAFFYKTHIKWLGIVGKYTMWIYILHQPVVYVILCLIFGKAMF